MMPVEELAAWAARAEAERIGAVGSKKGEEVLSIEVGELISASPDAEGESGCSASQA